VLVSAGGGMGVHCFVVHYGAPDALYESTPVLVPDAKDVAALAALAALVNAAESVMIFAGSGVRDARDDVLALAAALKAAIGHSLAARNGSATTAPTTWE
jgi:thiamine pyrophosphate-dependent acetolactate synthase large subunit-like protein